MTATTAFSAPPGISFPFTYSPQVSELLKTTPHEILAQNPHLTNLLVGAFVFNRQGKILLVKRADTEAVFPGLWEVPGGGFEPTDPTLLHAVSRELHEETGLTLTHIPLVFQQLELISSSVALTGHWRKYNFLVEIAGDDSGVADPVAALDHKEHSEYGWFGRSVLEEYRDVDGTVRYVMEFTTASTRKSIGVAFDLMEKSRVTGESLDGGEKWRKD